MAHGIEIINLRAQPVKVMLAGELANFLKDPLITKSFHLAVSKE